MEGADATADPAEAEADVDLWTFLQQQEGEADAQSSHLARWSRPWAQNPEALKVFQSFAQEQAQIGEQWQTVQEKAEAIGGTEQIPAVLDAWSGLVNPTRGTDGSFSVDRALDAIQQANPNAFYAHRGARLRTRWPTKTLGRW
ncbi:MAG: hypothetical protein U0Y68_20840 [Blastocatellia bacterium]